MPTGVPNAPPQNVRYTYQKGVGDGGLEFSWDEVPADNRNGDVTRYQYLLSVDGQEAKEGQEVRERRVSVQGVSARKKYSFQVRAGTQRGFGNWSAPLRPVLLDQEHDFMVPIVELTAMTPRKAGVRWQPLFDDRVVGYRVQYTDAPSMGNWKHEDVLNKTVDHMFIDNLTQEGTYQFCVQALIDEKKLSECASQKDLVLKPSRVVENLFCKMEEEKVARCTWNYNGPSPALFEVSYHLNKTYRMHDGSMRFVDYVSPVDNVTRQEVKVAGLRFNTRYTFFVSLVADDTIFLPQSYSLHTDVKPPPEFDPPKFVNATQKTVRLKLLAAADENGPVQTYWLVVAPSNYSKNITDFIDRLELESGREIYVAAALTQQELWWLPGQIIQLGDGSVSVCQFYGREFSNRPLQPKTRYRAFLRAFVDVRTEKNFRSSAWSSEFSLASGSSGSSAAQIVAGSMLWVLAPLAVLLVGGMIIGGICLLMLTTRKRRMLMNKRGSIAKVSLSALNGNQNETQKLLNDYHMPPPINGHVKPYETLPLSSHTVSGLLSTDGGANGGNLSSDDLSSERVRGRSLLHPNSGGGVSRMPIPVVDFAQHVDRLKQDDNLLFSKEYESIETDQHFTWEHSSREENRSKNRYANVIAYDHSRVVLSTQEVGQSDYINANFIDGYRRPRAYIATQGPLPETFGDFWRMVWEQRVGVVVMLTRLEERGRVKCDQYWPSRTPLTYGPVQVAPRDTQDFAHYTLRTFDISKVGGTESRELKQLQFTAWPDHGVPEHPAPFLLFLRRVQALNPPDAGPVLVHCSAGVGRTGAFIAVEAALERLRSGEPALDVCGCVAGLRAQRNYMVQTEEQYQFVHQAVLDAVLSGCTEVPLQRLAQHLHKLQAPDPSIGCTGLELEFRILASLDYGGSFSAASLPANKPKNRLVNILPTDSHRVKLAAGGGQAGEDYINASFIDGYRRRKAYVAAQAPLPNTSDDFWRMLWQTDSNIVVMLTRLREMGREKCHQYWPGEQAERFGQLSVEPIAEYNMPQYVLREFKLADLTTGQWRTVRHFQYWEWPEQGVPKSAELFIDFVGQVHKTREQFGQEGPITVHCSAGVGRTGVFVCLSVVLERMRLEGLVDIFGTIKLLRTQRPHMVQSEDQYEFCYRAALEYLGSFDPYALQLTD